MRLHKQFLNVHSLSFRQHKQLKCGAKRPMDATQEQLEKFWDNEKQRIRSLLPTTVDAHVQTTHRVTKKRSGHPLTLLCLALFAGRPNGIRAGCLLRTPVTRTMCTRTTALSCPSRIRSTLLSPRPPGDPLKMHRICHAKVEAGPAGVQATIPEGLQRVQGFYDRAKADWQTRMKTELPTHHHKILRAGDTISFGPIGNQTHATITKIAPITFLEG